MSTQHLYPDLSGFQTKQSRNFFNPEEAPSEWTPETAEPKRPFFERVKAFFGQSPEPSSWSPTSLPEAQAILTLFPVAPIKSYENEVEFIRQFNTFFPDIKIDEGRGLIEELHRIKATLVARGEALYLQSDPIDSQRFFRNNDESAFIHIAFAHANATFSGPLKRKLYPEFTAEPPRFPKVDAFILEVLQRNPEMQRHMRSAYS